MSSRTPKRRLRNLMIAYFVPMTVLPLAIMAIAANYLIYRGFSEQISRRARPELAAFSRNIESLSQQLASDIQSLQDEEEIRMALLSKDRDVISAFLLNNFRNLNFEKIVLYDAKGKQLKSLEQGVEAKWLRLLERINKDAGDAREPSAQSIDEDAFAENLFVSEERNQLSLAFQNFLKNHKRWAQVSHAEGDSVSLDHFIPISGTKNNFLGFVGASSRIDGSKLKLLSQLQGVQLVLLSQDLEVITASSPKLLSFFQRFRSEWANTVNRWWNADINEVPYAFFFSKLPVPMGSGPLWVSVGISKAGLAGLQRQVLGVLGVLGILMAIVSGFIVVGLSNRITHPISELVNAVEAMKEGKWVQPIEADSRTEMGYLVRRFNDMANSVQATKRMLETKLEELAHTHGDLKETQHQLVHTAKMSSLGQLVAGVAHELNNPIAFIYSNMTQMKEYMRDLNTLDAQLKVALEKRNAEEIDKLAQKIQNIEWDYMKKDMDDIVQSCLEGSVRVKDIVLGLRNFSRADREAMEDCDLNHCLRDTVKLLRGQLKNKAELHWDLCADAIVRANNSQINQVFMNLIANAAQSIEKSGNIWIDSEELDDKVRVRIRDDGKGISQKHIDKIFDPFYTTKKVGEGTGLGLSIVYGIIQRHGGSIEVKSLTEDAGPSGTEFVITLSRIPNIDVKSTEKVS